MTTSLLVERAGFVREAKQMCAAHNRSWFINHGRLFIEGDYTDYDITEWNIPCLRAYITGVLSPDKLSTGGKVIHR